MLWCQSWRANGCCPRRAALLARHVACASRFPHPRARPHCRIDQLRPPYFLYPSERDIDGSTRAFRALWERMQDRNVVMICRMAARENAAPRFVAVFAEVRDSDTG
jgi:hypothetical protein